MQRAYRDGWMIMPLLLLTALLLAGAPEVLAQQAAKTPAATADPVAAKADAYGWYTNHKYGFAIAWPQKLLTAMGESDAGDGQLFNAPDGQAQLRCWASFRSVETTPLKQLFQEAQQNTDLHVTYKHIGKTFFVVSGTQDGKIAYQKTIQGKTITATFLLTYAQSQRAVFDPVVGDIAKSFVADPKLQF